VLLIQRHTNTIGLLLLPELRGLVKKSQVFFELGLSSDYFELIFRFVKQVLIGFWAPMVGNFVRKNGLLNSTKVKNPAGNHY